MKDKFYNKKLVYWANYKEKHLVTEKRPFANEVEIKVFFKFPECVCKLLLKKKKIHTHMQKNQRNKCVCLFIYK